MRIKLMSDNKPGEKVKRISYARVGTAKEKLIHFYLCAYIGKQFKEGWPVEVSLKDSGLMVKHKINCALIEFRKKLASSHPRVRNIDIEPLIFARIANKLEELS
jgi:hypothetical protein